MADLKKGKAHKLGPGVLKFGETGSEIEFGLQCKAVTVEPEVDEDDDDIVVLTGSMDSEDDAIESYTLSGELYQDYSKSSLIAWCHVNAGKAVPFTFKPNDDQELNVRGTVRIRRLSIGGDVGDRNTSDFEFKSSEKVPYQLFAGDTEVKTYTKPAA